MGKGIFVTGMGLVSAIGLNVEENLSALKGLRSGLVSRKISVKNKEIIMAPVQMTDVEMTRILGINSRPVSRTSLLGLMAAKEAWQGNQHFNSLKTGLISATSVGGMDQSEIFYEAFLNKAEPDFERLRCHDSGTTTELIADALGISGYVNTLSTACSSGANAIMLGARLIRHGCLDRVVVGGTDALTNFTLSGFESLMIYDTEKTRPFDDSRAGLNLGEGAAFLILESEKSMKITGKKAVGQVSGWGNAADAYHQTASSPEGIGASLAMDAAISSAGLGPSEISYVNAHGTGTPNNDLSESVALNRVFEGKVPFFSSTKAFTGHTLAAAGAIEAVFSILSIREQLMWPNLNFETAITGTGLVPITEMTAGDVSAVLSNSFGFGGNNSSLVFTK